MSEKSTMQYTDNNGTPLDFDPSIPEEERRFYMKMYSTIDQVRDKKVHCTTCKIHIGTAPAQEEFIRMHPVLRVTHCIKCHDFYNSGEFSKGEDGSELYCRWCGQGGEVYCCSSCPYVFCKSCIVKNLTRGVVADIEQNENWSCFSCAPKILWPLRAQHWALVSYIEKQKRDILARKLPESEEKILFAIDRSNCCRQSKTKCGNMSDSVESIDSIHSRSSMGSTNPLKKPFKPTSTSFTSLAKRPKTSNDEVVCTPDVLSMLEPDCQITVSPKPRPLTSPITSTPKVLSVQTGYGSSSAQQNKSTTAPPPLVLRNTEIQMRALGTSPIMRRTVLSQRAPSPGNVSAAPVYHTINGYRIDLNSAALQDTFRLPNGKLIQVKRQGTAANTSPTTNNTNWQQRATTPLNFNSRPVQITPAQPQAHYANITQQHPISSATSNQQPQIMRFNNFVTNNSNSPVTQNGTHIQMINGVPAAPIQVQQSPVTVRPVILKHLFPNTPIGQARTQLQEQVFSAMDICQHLTGKIQTLTNSNAYKQARNYLEVKELYIHLSYLLTYAVGRFKSLQDKCITDMRQLGFGADADSLENGQLAADKQASDDEDNEIEIIEPKTDTINLDSDNEDDEPVKALVAPKNILIADTTTTTILKKKILLPTNTKLQIVQQNPMQQIQIQQNAIHINPITKNTLQGTSIQLNTLQQNPAQQIPVQSLLRETLQPPEEIDFVTAAQSFLASMLDIDEKEQNVAPSSGVLQRKQPRKKMTNKPNPTLIKQKLMLERERLEEMKRSDTKLKMECKVAIKKAEDEFPNIINMLNEKNAETKSDLEKEDNNSAEVIEANRDNDSSVEVIEAEQDNDSSVEVIEAKRDKDSSVEVIEAKSDNDSYAEVIAAKGDNNESIEVIEAEPNNDSSVEVIAAKRDNGSVEVSKPKRDNRSVEIMAASEENNSKMDFNNCTGISADVDIEPTTTVTTKSDTLIQSVCDKNTSQKDEFIITSSEKEIKSLNTEPTEKIVCLDNIKDGQNGQISETEENRNKNEENIILTDIVHSNSEIESTQTMEVDDDDLIEYIEDNIVKQNPRIGDNNDTENSVEQKEMAICKKNDPEGNVVQDSIQRVKINDSESKVTSISDSNKDTNICEKIDTEAKISSASNLTNEMEIDDNTNSHSKISSASDLNKEVESYENTDSEDKISSITDSAGVVEMGEKTVSEDQISYISDPTERDEICEKFNSEDKKSSTSITEVKSCEKMNPEDIILSEDKSNENIHNYKKINFENKISSISEIVNEVNICNKTDTQTIISSASNSIKISEKNDSDGKITSMSEPNTETEICKESFTEDNISSVSDSIKQVEDVGTLMEIDETITEDEAVDVNMEAEMHVDKEIEELLQKDTIEGSQTESHREDCSRTKDVEVTSTTVETETFLNSPDLFNDLIEVDPESMS
ncbi:uncharacterized protein LOC119685414 isoform X2 [Teleopsis dalmanni]|uniref:uncharacterized protein LOC119685414 isoform X2 n=1 Tax=Teleopsis dalmanni TaxID=139649 RepID=UPI0018CE3F90|nr:uncharacterized protein LOC119685414 isoform X2 [Teleopsis dalmanni]